ncbi:MAG: ABC transporter substrate-binding protein, partial [Campylobacterota bacterium]|nr:ABC transporter substrate-binding protein [Campylobacterota bacterium]
MRIVKILFFILMLLSQLNSMPIDKSASKVHQVSLQLMWKHQFEFAGFYMAKHQGFYRDVGLDVELKEFDFDTNIVDDVTSNTSTFGLGYPGIILDKASGKDIVLLGAMLQSSPHVLISLKSSNIKSIEDFKDRTINLLDDAIKTASFKSMLAVNNLSFEEMKKAKYRFNINDLISKKVDLSSVFLSNEPYALKQQNIQYDIWNPKDYGFEFYDDLLYTSSEYLNSNPQVVQSFTEASLKGWQYAYTHIEETIKVILEHYNTQNKTKEALLFEANVLKKLAYSDIENFGQIDAHKIQRILDVYNLQGLLKNKIDLNEFIYENKTNRILLSAKEQQYLKNNPVITVHNELNWPPYNFNINGQAKGFSIDYMNLVVSKLGIKAQYHVGPT